MTLDEAIVYAKEQTEVFGGTHREFLENVSEWLEEYKKLKENSFFNFDSPVARIDEKSYNKAIDEFAEKCFEEQVMYDCPLDMRDIEIIAEQLKAGKEQNMAKILEQLNNLKEVGYLQKAHLNVLEVTLKEYETEIRNKTIDEFIEEVKKAYATMKSIPSIEIATVNTVMLTVAEKMKAGGKNE